MSNGTNATNGLGLFNVIAMIISWSVNHSILWVILHGLCGLFYIIYYAVCVR